MNCWLNTVQFKYLGAQPAKGGFGVVNSLCLKICQWILKGKGKQVQAQKVLVYSIFILYCLDFKLVKGIHYEMYLFL